MSEFERIQIRDHILYELARINKDLAYHLERLEEYSKTDESSLLCHYYDGLISGERRFRSALETLENMTRKDF